MPGRVEKLSWLSPRTLWAARNGVVASWFGDPTRRIRARWVAQRAAAGAPADKVIRRGDPDRFSFMVLGDTGEGGAPQYAVVPGFLKASQGTSFAVIASDVIYPVGSTDDYGLGFFRPYQDYPAPIYAVPGNHDWYEDLGGFMRVFCGDVPPLPPEPKPRPLGRAWWRALLWRRPQAVDEQRFAAARELRSRPEQQAVQPGPYWAIDAGPVRKIYTRLFSPSSVTYSPPFFKPFLRLDVTPEAVRLRCFAVTGLRAQEVDPPVEDQVTIPLA